MALFYVAREPRPATSLSTFHCFSLYFFEGERLLLSGLLNKTSSRHFGAESVKDNQAAVKLLSEKKGEEKVVRKVVRKGKESKES